MLCKNIPVDEAALALHVSVLRISNNDVQISDHSAGLCLGACVVYPSNTGAMGLPK